MQLIRNHGEAVVEDMGYGRAPEQILGFNFRMGEIEAAIALEQLHKLDALTFPRQQIATILDERLGALEGLTVPVVHPDRTHVFDSANAAGGLALLSIRAAEAAARGDDAASILAMLEPLKAKTLTWAMTRDLTMAVRGGRVPKWGKVVVQGLGLTPVAKVTRCGRCARPDPCWRPSWAWIPDPSWRRWSRRSCVRIRPWSSRRHLPRPASCVRISVWSPTTSGTPRRSSGAT